LNINQVKKLRAETGISLVEVKQALDEAGGDEGRALELLRARGAVRAEKRQERETKAGIVEAYVHGQGRIGALVELWCETDFVARSPEFKALAHELALQIASMNPQYVSAGEIPPEVAEREKHLYAEEMAKSGKPPEIAEQIAEGRFKKRCQEICLLDQPYIKDANITVQELIQQSIASMGENIQVGRFARFEI